MLQERRGMGLVLESCQLTRVQHGGKGQHLEGHASAERFLLGLVDHPHPTPANLAQDAELAQGPRLPRAAGGMGGDPVARSLRSGQLRHRLHRGQKSSQPRLVLRVLANQFFHIDGLAGLQLLDHHFQQVAQTRIFAGAGCAG